MKGYTIACAGSIRQLEPVFYGNKFLWVAAGPYNGLLRKVPRQIPKLKISYDTGWLHMEYETKDGNKGKMSLKCKVPRQRPRNTIISQVGAIKVEKIVPITQPQSKLSHDIFTHPDDFWVRNDSMILLDPPAVTRRRAVAAAAKKAVGDSRMKCRGGKTWCDGTRCDWCRTHYW